MLFDKKNLIRTLQELPKIIETYIKNIPEDLLDKKRNETSWTIREHLYHIVNVQEMLYSRILKIRDEEIPIITPYFPEDESEQVVSYESLNKAFLNYKAIRQKQIILINQLIESDFKKEAKHDEYTRYNIPIIINHMIFHEYWHMYRVDEHWLTRDEYFS